MLEAEILELRGKIQELNDYIKTVESENKSLHDNNEKLQDKYIFIILELKKVKLIELFLIKNYLIKQKII